MRHSPLPACGARVAIAKRVRVRGLAIDSTELSPPSHLAHPLPASGERERALNRDGAV